MNTLLIANAIPSDGTGYVLAGYIFLLVLLLIYVGILAAKFQRLDRKVGRLEDLLENEPADDRPEPDTGQ